MLLSGESISRDRAQLPGCKIFQVRQRIIGEVYAKRSVRLAVNARCEDVKIVGQEFRYRRIQVDMKFQIAGLSRNGDGFAIDFQSCSPARWQSFQRPPWSGGI